MPNSISRAVRKRVVSLATRGYGPTAIASLCRISRSSVYRITRMLKRPGLRHFTEVFE